MQLSAMNVLIGLLVEPGQGPSCTITSALERAEAVIQTECICWTGCNAGCID